MGVVLLLFLDLKVGAFLAPRAPCCCWLLTIKPVFRVELPGGAMYPLPTRSKPPCPPLLGVRYLGL